MTVEHNSWNYFVIRHEKSFDLSIIYEPISLQHTNPRPMRSKMDQFTESDINIF
jgi:hypothetical protein